MYKTIFKGSRPSFRKPKDTTKQEMNAAMVESCFPGGQASNTSKKGTNMNMRRMSLLVKVKGQCNTGMAEIHCSKSFNNTKDDKPN